MNAAQQITIDHISIGILVCSHLVFLHFALELFHALIMTQE